MSFNVRTSGGDPHDGDNCWDNRKEVVGQIMQKYQPAVAGLQVGEHAESSRAIFG
jgi:hypothetical protein